VLLPPIFSNHNNFETERDTTKELKMNSIDIWSNDLMKSFFVISLSVFKIERFGKYERKEFFKN